MRSRRTISVTAEILAIDLPVSAFHGNAQVSEHPPINSSMTCASVRAPTNSGPRVVSLSENDAGS